VVDDRLAVAVEQVVQGYCVVRLVELVLLVEPHPGQPRALGGEFVAEPGQLLLAAEQGQAGGSPFGRTADARGRPRFA
jgi:hypothetical protein